MFKLVEPNEEVYALWVNKEQFFMFDSLYTNAGYKIIDGEPIRNFASHYGYFIIHKEDKTIGFMETIVFSIYQDKKYYLSDLAKMVDETNDKTNIREQVKELRIYSGVSLYAREAKAKELLKQAADTIESLSVKLQVANMERSTAYYNGGWISCSERLPDKSGSYLVTTYSSGISQYISDVDQFVYNGMPDGYWINCDDVIAWRPLPKPYKPE